MAFKHVLTPEDHETIKQMARAGCKYREIAAAINKVSHQRIKQLCKRWNIDAFGIRQEANQKEHADKMFQKFGDNWSDMEWRRSYIYQAMKAKYRQKKANSKNRGIPFTLDFGYLTFPETCPILGIELDYFNEEQKANSPSFDCVHPELGYVNGNVFIISMRANRIKNDGSAEEHLAIAKYIQQTPKP